MDAAVTTALNFHPPLSTPTTHPHQNPNIAMVRKSRTLTGHKLSPGPVGPDQHFSTHFSSSYRPAPTLPTDPLPLLCCRGWGDPSPLPLTSRPKTESPSAHTTLKLKKRYKRTTRSREPRGETMTTSTKVCEWTCRRCRIGSRGVQQVVTGLF